MTLVLTGPSKTDDKEQSHYPGKQSFGHSHLVFPPEQRLFPNYKQMITTLVQGELALIGTVVFFEYGEETSCVNLPAAYCTYIIQGRF